MTWPDVLPPQITVPLLDVERLQGVVRKQPPRSSQNDWAVSDILDVY